MLGSLPTAVKE